MSTETETVAEDEFRVCLTRSVRGDIQITFRVGTSPVSAVFTQAIAANAPAAPKACPIILLTALTAILSA